MGLNRRQFGIGLTGLAATASISHLHVPTKVDSAHTRYLHSSVDKLYKKDQSVGGGALTRDGLRLYHRARRMLDEADYSETVGRQLMSVSGELAVCAGWLAYDSGDQVLSRQLYSDARLLADQSGDDGLAIRSMEKMALQSARLAQERGLPGSAREAVRLSERATHSAVALAASGDLSGALEEGMTVSHRTLTTLQPVRRAAAHEPSGDSFRTCYDKFGKLRA